MATGETINTDRALTFPTTLDAVSGPARPVTVLHEVPILAVMKRLVAIGLGLAWAGLTGHASAQTPALTDQLKDQLVALERLAGHDLDRADLDNRVVVVAFFASWCPPCHVEFEHLNELYEAYRANGVSIVAVNLFENHGQFEDELS